MYNSLSLPSFTAQANGPSTPPVLIKFGDTLLHNITGPVPFVDFSKTFNFNSNGVVETITNNITLTGKIFRLPYDPVLSNESTACTTVLPQGSGIKAIVSGIKELENILTNCPIGTFSIQCGVGGEILYKASGVKVASYQIDKTENNWTTTADFSVNFEYITSPDPNSPLVSDQSDNWSIEPLDDTIYEDYNIPITQRGEWSNPQLKPFAATASSNVPAQAVNAPPTASNNNLRIVSIPQYRITRSLGCKGIPVQASSLNSNTEAICFTGAKASITNVGKYNQTAFAAAKEWVERELAKSYNGTAWKASGILYFTDTANGNNFDTKKNLYLYNHARNTSIDIYEGRYEVTESWIAMPTGISYTEEYNIDISTSEDFTKTVRVAGNIKGMVIANMDIMTGSGSQVVPGAKVEKPGQVAAQGFDGLISLTGFNRLPYSGPPNATNSILDANTQGFGNPTLNNKYQNALNAWLYNIKPYLYRRACLGTNSLDRTLEYIPISQQGVAANRTPQVPNNPIYCKEALLNPIPRATSEGHDPRKGTISYSYEYSNTSMIISGVVSENISISHDAPTDVVNETQVIGRSVGPIMTKTGRTSPRKTISIEIVVPKPSKPSQMWMSNSDCPLWTGGYLYDFIENIIEGVRPFGYADASYNYVWGPTYVANARSALSPKARNAPRPGIVFLSSDQDTWNPTAGRYSRTVSWTYQQCGNNIRYMDH